MKTIVRTQKVKTSYMQDRKKQQLLWSAIVAQGSKMEKVVN